MTSIEHQPATYYIAVVAMFVIYWMPEGTSLDTDVSFFNLNRSVYLNATVNLLGLKLDFSYPSLEVSHAINIRPISINFTISTTNDPKYLHIKNHSDPKKLTCTFQY